jgi:hypothetical protein
MTNLYTDRVLGGQPRDLLELAPTTATGLINLIRRRIDGNWFAYEYPDRCRDGGTIAGTDLDYLKADFDAVVPNALYGRETPDDATIFDLVEYAASRVREPENGRWHEYYRHFELSFDSPLGKRKFVDEVNGLLSRGRAAFEMSPAGEIIRLGTPEVRAVVLSLVPNSGDKMTDELIIEARARFESRDAQDRALGLERMWDAFERVKTLESGRDKKAQTEALLARFEPDELRTELNNEMIALTAIGNQFAIRHKEKRTIPVPDHAEDYLFQRIGGLVIYLLRHTNRIS